MIQCRFAVTVVVLAICTKTLNVLATIQESTRIKSGAWDENSVFVYTTSNHVKYALTSGCVPFVMLFCLCFLFGGFRSFV